MTRIRSGERLLMLDVKSRSCQLDLVRIKRNKSPRNSFHSPLFHFSCVEYFGSAVDLKWIDSGIDSAIYENLPLFLKFHYTYSLRMIEFSTGKLSISTCPKISRCAMSKSHDCCSSS